MQTNRALGASDWRSRDRQPSDAPSEESRFQLREKMTRDKEMSRRRRERTRDAEQRQATDVSEQGTRIYVGNMPYAAQKHDIEKVFEECEIEIVNMDISIDPFTHRNPSYCFVDLPTPSAATSAMQILSGKAIFGRPLKVRPCVQKRAPFPTSYSYQPYSSSLQSTRWTSHSASNSPPAPSSIGFRVRIDGLPRALDQHSSDLEIRRLFEDAGLQVEKVSKVRRPVEVRYEKGNQWFAFVDLVARVDVERAVERLDGMARWGGVVTVRSVRGNGGLEHVGR